MWLIDCCRVMEYDGTSQALPIDRNVHFFMDGFRGLERYCIQRASAAHNALYESWWHSNKNKKILDNNKNKKNGAWGLRNQLL